MNKQNAIEEYVLKEQMEEEEINETEFYAEQYADDLSMQHTDNEVGYVVLDKANRIKPFKADISDLTYELNTLKEIQQKLEGYGENQTPYTESIKLIANILNKGVEDVRDEVKIKNFEIEQIIEMK